MIITDKLVTLLAKHIRNNTDLTVFKYEHDTHFVGEYVAVNCLPVNLGDSVVNTATLNVNIHARKTSGGLCDIPKLEDMYDVVAPLIPAEDGTEDGSVLFLEGVAFLLKTVSQPKEDKDGTYYVNLKVKADFTLLRTAGIIGISRIGDFILSPKNQ